jgi:16S rRNA (guanine(966)-N(2))-methyltransferase RsmD
MRIIAGEFRSRKLWTPPDADRTRPIPDRVKESLFALLRGHCEDANVFDGFAGTGAIGLEAMSRGAARCTFVEMDRDIAKILEKNIAMLGIKDRVDLVIGDALGAGALARAPRPLNLAFLDPPYPLVRDPAGWMRIRAQMEAIVRALAPDGFAVLRTPWPFLEEEMRTDEGEDLAIGKRGRIKPGHDPRRPDTHGPRRPPRGKGAWDEVWSLERQTPVPEEVDDIDDAPPIEEGVEPAQDLTPADSKTPKTPVDMSIPGAVGPETHVYRGTAVHLYMRRPESAV